MDSTRLKFNPRQSPFLEAIAVLRLALEDELAELKVPRQVQASIHLCNFYASVLALTKDCLVLLGEGRGMSVGIIQRTIFEAIIDMRCLHNDPGHCERLLATYWKDRKRAIDMAMMGDSGSDARTIALRVEQHKAQKRCEDFQLRGIKPVKIREKFETANAIGAMYSIYVTLCDDTHNSIVTLFDRHVSENGDDFEFHIDRDWDVEEGGDLLKQLAISLPTARAVLAEHFNLPANPAVSQAISAAQGLVAYD